MHHSHYLHVQVHVSSESARDTLTAKWNGNGFRSSGKTILVAIESIQISWWPASHWRGWQQEQARPAQRCAAQLTTDSPCHFVNPDFWSPLCARRALRHEDGEAVPCPAGWTQLVSVYVLSKRMDRNFCPQTMWWYALVCMRGTLWHTRTISVRLGEGDQGRKEKGWPGYDMERNFRDTGLEARCREKPLEKSGLKPSVPNRR